ncbi:unnamed protein product [Gulo gulo]|uniref:Uncharacterized protein n=1 Tax=Gulo gulo TaxID=48420 RepID=A0A9X9MA03_GULGU|nr:unnamed protein product [Gulo gulo]
MIDFINTLKIEVRVWVFWLAQSMERVTLALRVVSSSPTLGIQIIKNK